MKLKDLAEHLGLSQTTVSRALNGYPEVNEATRKRVTETADRLGYRPNASALRLATGRSGAVGLVTSSSEMLGPHMSEFISGVGSVVTTRDQDILVTIVNSRAEELAAYRRLAASKKVDAVIVHSPTTQDERVELLLDLGLPFVLHGRTNTDKPIAFLDIDNEAATERATTHLLDLGHTRIGLLNGNKGQTFAVHRERGYRTALASRNIRFDPTIVVNTPFTDEMGFRMAQTMLAQKNPPTAFLPGSMMTALGVFRAIRQAGLTLGKDVSIIAHDDVFPYLNADNMYPSMSTTRSPIRQAGIRIAELITQILEGKSPGELQEVWPVELVLRESSGPAPNR